jgi:hypothetical protein
MSRPDRTKVLVNARVITMEEMQPRAEAISFSGGKITYVGTREGAIRLAPQGSETIDIGGRTLIPGFIDCHTHFLSMGVWKNRLDLSTCRSQEDVLRTVGKKAKATPSGKWILGRGWDEAKWRDSKYLDRRELDGAAPANPVMLIRVCGHMAAVNSPGLMRLKGRIGHKGVDRTGGLLRESALEKARFFLRPGPGELAAGMNASLDNARKLGVTSVHDIIDRDKLRAYEAAYHDGRLTVRACLHFEQGDFSELPRRGAHPGREKSIISMGGMKLYADGSFGARTAALNEPYKDDLDEKGELLFDDDTLKGNIRRAEKSAVQLLVHAIGDRAVSQVILAFSSALGSQSRLRHRIEHLELVTEEELALMRSLGIYASMQPNFVGEWGRPGGMMHARLGKRYERADPFRRVLDAGVPLIFGSDCMPFSPLYGIHSAVNAHFPAQKITVDEAIAAYTRTAAAASFEEGFKGTLAPGKAADMAVLGADPFRVPSEIDRIKVDATIFDGKMIWRRPKTLRRSSL